MCMSRENEFFIEANDNNYNVFKGKLMFQSWAGKLPKANTHTYIDI